MQNAFPILLRSRKLLGAGAGLLAVFLWAYWTTLLELAALWREQPDYAHGFLVIPLAGWLLWMRRDTAPEQLVLPTWGGVALIAASIGLRFVAVAYHAMPLDAWSIVLWLGGVVWLLGGLRLLRWALPALLFLVFMAPLPYRVEYWLNEPLQTLSTSTSCFLLQTLGLPALAEGHTLWLGGQTFEVQEACSGLRIFVGVLALAYLLAVTTRQGWWERAWVLLAVAPVAVLANSVRIVVTGLLYQNVSGEAGERFAHDFSGWLTVPLAAVLLGLVLWASGQVLRRTEVADVGDLLWERRAESTG